MSQDELAIKFVIDPTQFREELSRLRRDLEDQHRIEIDKFREEKREEEYRDPSTVVEIRETMVGVSDEERVKQYVDEQIDLLRRERGLLPEESRVTPDMLMELFSVAINRYQAGERWAWKEGEDDTLTQQAQRVYNMITDLKDRYGGRTELETIRTSSISDSVAIRETMGLIEELRQDLVEGEKFGRPGAIQTKVRRALTAYARGVEGSGGEGLMHKGLKKFLEDMSGIIKGGEVDTGREMGIETGGRLDVGMFTDETFYFGEVKTGDAGADARRQMREYLESAVLRRFMKETEWRGGIPERGTPERARFFGQAIQWAQRVGPERIAARKEGQDIPKSIKGLLLAPYTTGNLAAQLMEDIRQRSAITSAFVGAPGEEETWELGVTIAEIPIEATTYVAEGMAAIRRGGEAPNEDDWNRLFMEWVSGRREHPFAKQIIGALNALGVDPDEFEAMLDERLGDYHETIRQQTEAGEPPTPQQIRTGAGRVLRGARGWEGATLTDIRGYLRKRVPSPILEPYPRGPISGLIDRGAGHIAKFMRAALPERPAEEEEREVSELAGVTEEDIGGVTQLARQLRVAEADLPRMLDEFRGMQEGELVRLRDEGATPEEIREAMKLMDDYRQANIEGVTQLREEITPQIYPAWIGMEFDPKEYLEGMKKVAKEMGFKGTKGWDEFTGLVKAKDRGELGEHLKEKVGSVMAVVGATMKDVAASGVLSEEQEKSLIDMIGKTPRLGRVFKEFTPSMDETGSPDSIDSNKFRALIRERITVDDLPYIKKELDKILRNPEINAMLNPENLTGLHNAAIAIKRAERATMDLVPAFGGLDYWV